MNFAVSVRGQARLVKKDDEGRSVSISRKEASNAFGQAVEDAGSGTFGAYPSRKTARLPTEFDVQFDDQGDTIILCNFTFELDAAMFPAQAGGLQHLIGVLCGDTFRAPSAGVHWSDVQFTDIVLPNSMKDAYKEEFGEYSHNLTSVRTEINLSDGWPLLAFTYKPRIGVPYEEFEREALAVLRAGFNLVEPDTRRLTAPSDIEQWVNLGKKAAKIRRGETAFAPNLTLPVDLAVEAAIKWRENCPEGPFVVKVDGGLDGLSTIQGLRRTFREDRPVVTCYPLFRAELARLPSGFFNEALLMSGADIIYPGGRPNFHSHVRALDADTAGEYAASARRYRTFIEERMKMPTFAGGAHPAELHSAYLLLGPHAGLFLGGAVALHADGPGSGARLCRSIVAEAIQQSLRKEPKDLPEKLIREIEKNYSGSAFTGYVPPDHFEASDDNRFPVAPFWETVK